MKKIFLILVLHITCSKTYSQAGALDLSFNSTGRVTTDVGGTNNSDYGYGVAIQTDGKIVCVGGSNDAFGESNFSLARYNINGGLDVTFNTTGKIITNVYTGYNDYAYAVALQSDGKIVAAGYSWNGATYALAVARYNVNGTLDNTFNTIGTVITTVGPGASYGYAVAIQSDGKIVVAGKTHNGSNQDVVVARYNTNGSLDNTFNVTGIVTTSVGTSHDEGYAVSIQSDGKIVVGGSSYNGSNWDFLLVRYNSNGTLDNTFNSTGKVTTAVGTSNDLGNGMVLQPDGKIILAGQSTASGQYNFALARYTTTGALDVTFNSTGKVITPIGSVYDAGTSVCLQPDGKIIVAGRTASALNVWDFGVIRYNSSGSLDLSFNSTGKVTTDFGTAGDRGSAVALQADGKIVVGGETAGGGANYALARYLGCSAPSVTANASSTSICLGNTVTLTGSGATSYTWTGGVLDGIAFSPTATTIYSVTGAAGSCTAIAAITVTVDPTPTISVNSGSICSGSSFTIVPSGANTYTIQGGSFIVSPGTNATYTITGTNSAGCVSASSATSNVNVVATPTAAAGPTVGITSCTNPTVSLSGSGVSSYTWTGPGIVSGSNTANPIVNTVGVYTLVGNTGGCSSNTSTTQVYNMAFPPTATIYPSPMPFVCAGNSLTLTVSAPGAVSYSWSTGATGLSTVVTPTANTNYTVMVTGSNGCFSFDGQLISVNPLPTVTANTSASIICGPPFQGTATVSANGANTYTWNTSATTSSISVSPSITTQYTVMGTDANGCVNTAVFTQSVSSCTGINEISINNGLIIFPNPTNGQITLISRAKEVEIFNSTGKLIYKAKIENEMEEINLEKESSGIYFIKVDSEIRKIIKE